MQNTTTQSINTFGNLTNNPVVRTSTNNKTYTVFTVAYNPSEGERAFVKCFVWGKNQQSFANKLQKGNRVHVIGDATQRETRNGEGVTFLKLAYFKKYERKQAA